MRGILGNPMKRGKSDAIEAATYTTKVTAGCATTQADASNGDGQLTVKPFDAAGGFAGFAVANDLNTKNQTVSVISSGLDVPVVFADGKSFTRGDNVSLDATGKVVPAGDAGAVYDLNATVRRTAFTGLDETGAEKQAITIDLFGGGAASGA